ncbi:MAG: hypothetical protein WD040_06860, partial [Anaerolineales bacterium]
MGRSPVLAQVAGIACACIILGACVKAAPVVRSTGIDPWIGQAPILPRPFLTQAAEEPTSAPTEDLAIPLPSPTPD